MIFGFILRIYSSDEQEKGINDSYEEDATNEGDGGSPEYPGSTKV